MKFKHPLQSAILLRRYKRFLADVELPDGTLITVHCPNSGSMLGCREPGMEVRISESANPKRKYPHTLEMVHTGTTWAGINTSRTNHLVREAMENGVITEIGAITSIEAEVKTSPHTRLDFLVHSARRPWYIEVKNCTLAAGNIALFPDAVTQRGTRHLNELMDIKMKGRGAALIFCIQRNDVAVFSPAHHIDPLYARTLLEAQRQGVLILAYEALVSPEEIRISHAIPVHIPNITP